jgi:glucose dehydrogenase
VDARRGYAGGTSGIAYALDQETGELVWSFRVVEDDFWGNPEINSGGGIWYPPAVDPETGLTFWATGNPAPFPGTIDYPNASSRPGDNLYTNTMLALDLHSG